MKPGSELFLRVRKAQVEDAASISLLIQTSIQSSYERFYTNDEIRVWKEMYSTQKIKDLFLLEREMWVLRLYDTICGTIHYDFGLNEICTFYLHPDFQNLGLGKFMLAGLICILKTDRIEKVELSCNRQVMRWYEKYFGFRIVRKEHVICGGIEFEEFRMCKNLIH